MIEDLFTIERFAYRQSIIHSLDARAKIIATLAAIIAMVAIPYTPVTFAVGLVFLILIACLWGLSRLPVSEYFVRLCLILPFGLFIILFQIFFENRFYPEFHTLVVLPFGVMIFSESVEFAGILLVKFVASVSFIILLSSTTKVQDILEGAGRLGLPAEFGLVLGMMIRYLYVFAYMYRKSAHALATRCFDPFDPSLPYQYRIRELGYLIGTFFLRAYEQGERTYLAMLCRGYGKESHIFITRKPLNRRDWTFLAACLAVVIATPVWVVFLT
jgi:cobalt/nickel transport system permease protein